MPRRESKRSPERANAPYSKDFFISYTQADRGWAEWVAWELQEAGYSCVYQAQDFAPSQSFMQRMRQAVTEARHTVAILSDDYLSSEYAGAELDAALTADPRGLRAKLIPVRVAACTPDDLLKSRIHIDLVGKDQKRARRDLLSGIEAVRATMSPVGALRFPDAPMFPGADAAGAPARTTTVRRAGRSVPALFVGMEIGRGLDLQGQFRGVRSVLRGATKAGPFRLVGRFDATAESLPDLLTDERPEIVHFSGNQSGGRILIRSESGGVTTVPARALAGLLQSLDGAVRLAIVDTCDSLPCAQEVAETVDLALGVKGKPFDEDAIAFYLVFYKALAAGFSVHAAFGQAKAAHGIRGVRRDETPHLCVRKGVDPRLVDFGRGPARGA